MQATGEQRRLSAGHVGYWATETPTLSLSMLLPRGLPRHAPFPFSEPNVRYVFFARNGIYALASHLQLAGEEVLFPAYFQGVELEALLAAGARPRFFPVHQGMRVEPEEVLGLITPATRAIYLTHYLGFPGPVEALREMCEQHGLWLIEDCALSMLSCLGPRPLGSFGHASIFCLYKSLPTPHGGAILLRDGSRLQVEGARKPGLAPTLAQVAALLLRRLEARWGPVGARLRRVAQSVGKPASRAASRTRVQPGTDHFDPAHAGLLMSSLAQIVLERQDFDGIVKARRRNYLHLLDELKDLAPPVFPNLPPGVCPLSYPFVTSAKQDVWAGLRAQGIEAVNFWSEAHPAVPWGLFPEVDRFRHTVLELPCHQDLAPEAVARLARIVRQVVPRID